MTKRAGATHAAVPKSFSNVDSKQRRWFDPREPTALKFISNFKLKVVSGTADMCRVSENMLHMYKGEMISYVACIGCQNDIIRVPEDMLHILYMCRGTFHMVCV